MRIVHELDVHRPAGRMTMGNPSTFSTASRPSATSDAIVCAEISERPGPAITPPAGGAHWTFIVKKGGAFLPKRVSS